MKSISHSLAWCLTYYFAPAGDGVFAPDFIRRLGWNSIRVSAPGWNRLLAVHIFRYFGSNVARKAAQNGDRFFVPNFARRLLRNKVPGFKPQRAQQFAAGENRLFVRDRWDGFIQDRSEERISTFGGHLSKNGDRDTLSAEPVAETIKPVPALLAAKRMEAKPSR